LTPEGLAFLASLVPLFNTSVDRLEQVPRRLQQLFEFAPDRALADPEMRAEADAPAVRQVIEALADELEKSPRLADKEMFRSLANVVKQRTGQKGKALFHPIRLALTGAGDGPELDLLVPAIERGAELSAEAGFVTVVGARERAARFVKALASSSPAST
jgi:glutamyl/glutaminyl-tRNA synthetase